LQFINQQAKRTLVSFALILRLNIF